jgi:hypothetical protein
VPTSSARGGLKLTPEDEARLNQLAAVARALAACLIRIGRRGTVTLTLRIEARPRLHISRASRVSVEKYPLMEAVPLGRT